MAPPFRKLEPRDRPIGEQHVWHLFMNGAYQALGCCKNPTCPDAAASVMTAGMKPSTRVCLICFEFEFNCTFPRVATLEGMRRG